MKLRRFTRITILALCVGIAVGCSGQPRVAVITSTMVGLEAKPPMGDAQPNPSVSLAYRRAEMALVPVCRVPEYSWWHTFMEWLGLRDKNTPEQSTAPIEAKNVNGKTQSTVEKPRQQSNSQCPPKGSNGADAYAVLGSFQMAHNWFGPLNIRQFIATGMAARHLVTPTVHVIGEVKNPGRYRYEEGLTIEKALSLAGGSTDKDGKVKIKATQMDKAGKAGETREVEEKAAVLPGDIIVVVREPPLPSEDKNMKKSEAAQETTQPTGATSGSEGQTPAPPQSAEEASKGSSEK